MFLGARMMYHLDPSQQEAAIKLATTLDKDIEGVNLQVCSVFGYDDEYIMLNILHNCNVLSLPIMLAGQSKLWVCGR